MLVAEARGPPFNYTFSKNVSGLFLSNISEAHITVTRSSVSLKLISRGYRNSTTGELMEIRPGKRVKVKMSEKVMKAIDPESNVEN